MIALPTIIAERLDRELETSQRKLPGRWLVDKLEDYWSRPAAVAMDLNTIAFDFNRDRETITIADIISLFDPFEVPYADFRDYLLARYP